MEYIYAVMLLTKAGKQVTEASVSAVLSAAGVAVDATKIKSLLAALEGVNVEKVISEVSFAGGAAAPAASAAPAAAAAPAEKKKEEASFDAAAGLGSLF